MFQYICRRVMHAIPLLILVMILSFFIIHIMPGDPIRTMLGDKASEEQIIRMRKEMNLDKSILEQFTIWVKNTCHFDFGTSIMWKEPALKIISERIEPTFLLALIGTVLSVIIGIPLGIISAKMRGSLVEKGLSVLSLISISLPAFCIAIFMIQVFAVKIHLFPVAGYHSIQGYGLKMALKDLLLPGLVLGVMHSGQIGRMTKASMLDVLQEEYLRTARAEGINEINILFVYALKNALPAIVVVIAFNFAGLLAGAVVVEQIFNIPGVGNLTITAILSRDYPLIQGTLLFVSLIFIIVNMLADILCAVINPKIRYDNE